MSRADRQTVVGTEEEEESFKIPEVRLLAAIIARSVQDYSCPLSSRESLNNARLAWLFFYSDLSENVPFSFRWILAHLFPESEVEGARTSILAKCEKIRRENMQGAIKIISWKGFLITRKVKGKEIEH